MATYLQRERRRRFFFWLAVLVLTGLAAAVSYHLTGPPPPKKISLATGEPGGAYAAFGQQYAEILEQNGLEVDLVRQRPPPLPGAGPRRRPGPRSRDRA